MPTYRRRNFGKSSLGRYDWWRCPNHPGYMQPSGPCPDCTREAELAAARAAVERDLREWEANEIDLPPNERFSR